MEISNIQFEKAIELIKSASSNVEAAHNFFSKKVNFNIPKNNYTSIWYALIENLSLGDAIELIFEYILNNADKRQKQLFEQALNNGEVEIDYDDADVINLLFFQKGTPRKLGSLFIEFLKKRRGKTKNKVIVQTQIKNGTSLGNRVDKLDMKQIENGISSAATRGLQLEKVKFGFGKYLTFKKGCSELEIENYIVENWSQINFGFEEPLTLVGRQIRLNIDSNKKADLLAKVSSNKWIVIEIKAKTADWNAIGQLQEYMSFIDHELGLEEENLMGLLVAPGFSDKVINGLQKSQRIELLQFYLQE